MRTRFNPGKLVCSSKNYKESKTAHQRVLENNHNSIELPTKKAYAYMVFGTVKIIHSQAEMDIVKKGKFNIIEL